MGSGPADGRGPVDGRETATGSGSDAGCGLRPGVRAAGSGAADARGATGGAGPLSELATPAATRAVLEAFGLSTKKALGQHFLVNDHIIHRICELADLTGTDDVAEVGPGIGTLTCALLKRARRVVSIERDVDLPAVLASTLAPYGEAFHLISGDALEVGQADFPFRPAKLVANLPYAVAATIILAYFERFEWIESQTVMVQAEVADRIMARPGTKEYGAFTVKLGMHAKPTGRFKVGASNFFPPPRVESAVIRLDRIAGEDSALVHAACMLADAAFAQRRKTILNSMRGYFASRGSGEGEKAAGEAIPELLAHAGIDARRRGESLEREEFLELGRVALASGFIAQNPT